MLKYAPHYDYHFYTPKINLHFQSFLGDKPGCQIVLPDSKWEQWLHPLWRSKGIVNQLENDGIQLFHGLSNELPLGLEKAGIKSVLTLHDLIFLRFPQYYPRVDRMFYRKKFERSCKEADVVVAISQQTALDIQEFYQIDTSKLKIIYQDCHPRFRKSVSQEEIKTVRFKYDLPEQYLLSVGTLESRKNQLTLLKAYTQLPADRPPLVLVGRKTAYFEQMESFFQSAGIEQELIFLELVEADDLPAIYHAALAMAYVSEFEGFGLPLLEAMCTGTPVLTSTTSCFSEVVGEAALYSHPHDVDAMTDALHRLVYTSAVREKLKAHCAEQAARFSAEKMAGELANIYTTLVS